MPRKRNSKSASSSRSREFEKWDAFSVELHDNEEQKPLKARRSSTKNEKRHDDDPADRAENGGGVDKDVSNQKTWFWQRRKSDKADGGDSEKERSKRKSSTVASNSDEDEAPTSRPSIQTKATQANRHTKTIEDCETEYHEVIRDHDWDVLEGLLKEYDPMVYKKAKKKKKEPKGQPKKNIKLLKYMPDLPKLRKEKEEPEIPISPLLALDRDGRTPLHLCCVELTPSKLLLRVMNCERNAAAIKDKDGNLPLHLAIRNRRKVNVIERLVRGYYQGSWTGDGQNRTPLSMAIEVVIQKQDEEEITPTKTYWGFPASPEDLKWQGDQEKIWKVPGFLIQNRIDRRKRLLTVEHNQIFVALNKCAPPKIISNMLAAGRNYWEKNGEVAQRVLFLLISRQYPIFLFKSFLDVHSADFTKKQKDFTGCGVVATHFRVGCIKPVDQNSKREKDSFAITMKRLAFAKKNGKDLVLSPQYTEWWEKLKFFINLWAWRVGDDDQKIDRRDKLLLHNALRNSDSPPLLIQLLGKLYPKSILISHPYPKDLPLHLACREWRFKEHPPRRGEKIVNQDQICTEFLREELMQIRKRHRGRLPLHLAIAAGKSWDFVKPLVLRDLKSLLARDPMTKLRPFQMAAHRHEEIIDVETLTRREYSPIVWNTMFDEEKDRKMRKLLHFYDLNQLTLIYELLRHSPDAATKILSYEERLNSTAKKANQSSQQELDHQNLVTMTKTKVARSLFGLGNVGGHFIGWCYEGDSKGAWKPDRKYFPMVKEAIINGFIPNALDKWWRRLNFWLWLDCPWDNIPRQTDFLLHCALCNSKVSPWIIELILECFPRSAAIPLPNSGDCYPLHIACVTDTYIPMEFEFCNKRNVIEMVAKAFDKSILLKWNNLLPLHYAILGSKNWSEMRFMAEDEPVSLAIPDSENDFFPFQLMALHKMYTKAEIQRFVNIAMTKVGKNLWEKTNPDERVEQLKQVLFKHEIDSLGCIFELLKRNPMLVHVGTAESKNRIYSRSDSAGSAHRSAGKISMQEYLKMIETESASDDLRPSEDLELENETLEINSASDDLEPSEDLERESAILDSLLF